MKVLETLQRYETQDGSIFNSFKEAKQYENSHVFVFHKTYNKIVAFNKECVTEYELLYRKDKDYFKLHKNLMSKANFALSEYIVECMQYVINKNEGC